MERLFKTGLISTILGVLILCVGVWLYVSDTHTQVEAGAVSAIALILLRSKDSLIGLGSKK